MTQDPLHSCLDALPVAVLKVTPDGTVSLANRASVALLGYGREELIGLPVEQLVPEAARATHARSRGYYLTEPMARPMGAGKTIRAVRRDGSETPVQVTLGPLPGTDGPEVVITLESLVERERLEGALRVRERQLALARQQIQGFSATDPVTRARNRATFFSDLRQQVALSMRTAHPLSLLTLDIDGFGDYNVTYGQEAGDQILRQTAGVLRQTARQSDLVSRIAADSFTVLLPGADDAGSQRCASRIGQALSLVDWRHGPRTFSTGMATLIPELETLPRTESTNVVACQLYNNAQAALDVARRRGGGQSVHCLDL